MTLYDELGGVLAQLDRANVEYALLGGLAVAVWGAPRATKDIDLLVRREDHEIRRVYVHPSAQRKGVGRALVDTLEARKRHLGALTVHASPSSVPFYRSLGYQPEERVTSRHGEAEFTHVRMSKPLR